MNESRRRFLKRLGSSTIGAGVGLPVLGSVLSGRQHAGSEPAAAGRQWAMVVDVAKCLRPEVRDACVAACDRVHNVPRIPAAGEEVKWIWNERWEHVFPDQVHLHTPAATREAPVLVLCNHCTNPPCVKVCPTGATFKRPEDGIVMMDMHRCIGCRYCMAACPYGARSFNWQDPAPWVERGADGMPLSDYPTRTAGVVEKCTFCAERIRIGQLPACVEAVNAVPGGEGALTFGDLSEPDSEVRRLLNEANTIVRREALGTGPNVYYIVPAVFPAAADGRA